MTKYNKAFVPLVMALIYFLNEKYGMQIPLSEDQIAVLMLAITSFFTYLIPNSK